MPNSPFARAPVGAIASRSPVSVISCATWTTALLPSPIKPRWRRALSFSLFWKRRCFSFEGPSAPTVVTSRRFPSTSELCTCAAVTPCAALQSGCMTATRRCANRPAHLMIPESRAASAFYLLRSSSTLADVQCGQYDHAIASHTLELHVDSMTNITKTENKCLIKYGLRDRTNKDYSTYAVQVGRAPLPLRPLETMAC